MTSEPSVPSDLAALASMSLLSGPATAAELADCDADVAALRSVSPPLSRVLLGCPQHARRASLALHRAFPAVDGVLASSVAVMYVSELLRLGLVRLTPIMEVPPLCSSEPPLR